LQRAGFYLTLKLEIGGIEILLGVLMQCANSCDDGFIAGIEPFANLAIAHTQYTICNKNKADGFYTIFWVNNSGKIFSVGIFLSKT
jgi:hypothetical protein